MKSFASWKLPAAAIALALLVATTVACAGDEKTSEKAASKEAAGKTATAVKEAAAPETPAQETPAKETAVKESETKAADAKGYAPGTMPVKPAKEPERVQVQHILIGFKGSVPGKPITRTMEEAKALAYQILERARKGEDFGALVREFTDDRPPGVYAMSNNGVTPNPGEYARSGMVPAFGNVGFAISVGNIGIADHDPKTSPYGWHVIKRVK